MRRFPLRLWRDRRAVSATEFALILPFMLIILIGMVEVSGALDADRKVSRIANSITDLVAQAQTVTSSELKNIADLGGKILAPYPDTDLEVIIASVSFNEDGDASVDWSYDGKVDEDGNLASPWAKGSVPPITLPDTVAMPDTSLVISQTNLAYTPPFSGLLNGVFYGGVNFADRLAIFNLSDTFYLRPRLTDTVRCDDC